MKPCLDAKSRDRLTTLCKLGRLYDAEKLLVERGTARLRKTRKWTPLMAAACRGVHSLVELLLRFDHAQWDLEKAHAGAIRHKRGDLAGMILRSSWWSGEIDPVEALITGDTELVCKLVASGVDFTKAPIVNNAALRSAWRTIKCLRAANIPLEAVEGQLYSALIAHAMEGHLQCVVHLLRAGLDPHKPVVWHEHADSEHDKMSAVRAAVFSHDPSLLAILKPSPDKDDAERLVGSTMWLGDRRMLLLLLDAGFSINSQKNGGSPALHDILKTAGILGIRPDSRGQPPYDWATFTADIEWLIRLGAKWVAKDNDDYRRIRDALVKMGRTGAKSIVGMMLEGGAISESEVSELLRTPRVRSIAASLGIR